MADFMKAIDSFVEFVGSNAEKAINSVGEHAKQAKKVVTEKTTDFIDEQKIKSDIRSLQKVVDANYSSIGKKVYEAYKKGEEVGTSCDDLCKDIEAKELQIAELRRRLDVE